MGRRESLLKWQNYYLELLAPKRKNLPEKEVNTKNERGEMGARRALTDA